MITITITITGSQKSASQLFTERSEVFSAAGEIFLAICKVFLGFAKCFWDLQFFFYIHAILIFTLCDIKIVL